jgi:lipoprotein
MKKKTVLIGSTLLLLVLGGVSELNVINPSWRENTIFATARDKQLAYLKAHEEEIVAWIHSKYPKVETVKFDWSTYRVGPVSNGVSNNGYKLSVKGTFNELPETVLYVSFGLDNADSMPDISRMGMNHPPGIRKNGVLINYE